MSLSDSRWSDIETSKDKRQTTIEISPGINAISVSRSETGAGAVIDSEADADPQNPGPSGLTCPLCQHNCRLAPGETGFCGARGNTGRQIVNRYAGLLTGLALDPIEKKPLACFHPGTYILSAGGFGCNLTCPFCQNCHISQITDRQRIDRAAARNRRYSPAELVQIALDQRAMGNIGLAFTYNEPLINFEYILETFSLARSAGLETVLITNGSFHPGPVRRLAELTTAWNIDLKCFSDEGYRSLNGSLDLVRSTIELAAACSHLEITTLVIPGFSDNEQEITEMTSWLAGINPDIPYHLSRYFPGHRLTEPPPTPLETLHRLKRIAEQKLKRVFLGNV